MRVNTVNTKWCMGQNHDRVVRCPIYKTRLHQPENYQTSRRENGIRYSNRSQSFSIRQGVIFANGSSFTIFFVNVRYVAVATAAVVAL